MTTFNRRFALAAVGALALAAGGTAAQAAEIRVLNWKGYGTDEPWAVQAFEKKTGHKVVHDYFTSEQEMLTKLRTNPGAYDVVLINSAYTKQAKDEGLIGKVDTADISNMKDIGPDFAKNADLVPGGEVYGVPWIWGVTSFGVNKNQVSPAPDSLQVFWDPKHKGKVGWRDDPVEAVQFAALATGQGINDIKDLDAVKTKLKALMPQVKTFWSSENDWNQFMSAGDFVLAPYWSGSAGRSISKGLPITYVIPKEGAIGWVDGLSIPRTSKNPQAARAFIDYLVGPEFYGQWAAKGAPASVNAKAAAALPETNFNKATLGDPAILARVQFMRPVSDENRKKYLELWQDVKTAR